MSAGRSRAPPYVAIAKSFIKDLRYRRPTNRPLTHIEAIIWLLSDAAWKPKGSPTRFGSIHNERAQLSTTHRQLAKDWGWSKGKVGRWLAELVRDGTILVELARCGAEPRAETKPQTGYPRTLITLVNYDKFNGAWGTKNQNVGQNVGQNSPELPGLLYAIASQPTGTRQAVVSSKTPRQASRGGGFVHKPLPEHNKRTRDGLMLFLRHDTDEWRTYAADFEAHRGFAPIPTRYLDGRGNWFITAGEGDEEATA